MTTTMPSFGVGTLSLPRSRADGSYRTIRRVADVALSAIGLAFLLPLLLVIALLVRRDGGGALFRHVRVGPDGRSFACLKFRTMHLDADQRLAACLAADEGARREWAARQKLALDPRVTPTGRFLRRLSLDELPQLVNVLRGEMSLIGPRPVPAEELARYGRARAAYLACTPGMTGLWQVSARRAPSYRRRIAYDRFYATHQGLRLDALIAWRTVLVVIAGSGE